MAKSEEGAQFAVVFFEGDDMYSEVPTNWLTADKHYCWWPSKTRNLTSLITKRVPPTKNWDKFAVRVECLCSTVESARKKAVDSNYTSAEDEDNIGRGKRKKRSTRTEDQSEDESSDNNDQGDVYPSPPKLQRKDSTPRQESLEVLVTEMSSQNLGPLTVEKNTEIAFTPPLSPLDIDENIGNTPSSSHLSSFSLFQDTGGIQNMLGKIGKTFSFIKLSLQNIEKRLVELETNKGSSEQHDYDELLLLIPINDNDKLKVVENYLSEPQNRKLLRDYLNTVGGRDAKDATHRILSKMFTNSMGIGCSWLGQRNNIRIRDLKCIALIKAVLMSQYSDFKETNFEHACSEWFRQAKMRHNRELKKTENN